jgi:hypothetical protein
MGPKKMLLSIFFLILLEQRWILLIAGVLVLVVAISLVVYFRRRLKTVEKEPEEDWQAGMRSIFAGPTATTQPAAEPLPVEEIEAAESEVGTRILTSDSDIPEGFAAIDTEPEVIERAEPEAEQPPPVEEPPAAGRTQVLYSEQRGAYEPVEATEQEEAARESDASVAQTGAADEAAVFDEEVWAQLDEEGASAAEPVAEETVEPPVEEPRVERVEQRITRELFEPPRIKPITHRDPFEPPRIEPLTPRQQDAFVRERDRGPVEERREERPARPSPLIPPAPLSPAAERRTDVDYAPAQEENLPAPPVVAASLDAVRARRAPAGSVLGLPAESSDKPLVLGDPVRATEEAGIGALSRYGKRSDEKTGHTGTIILAAVVLLIGGIIAAYFLVPQFHEWVNTKYAGLRGNQGQEVAGPKARIVASSPSVTNKVARAAGIVENISNETLETLAIEVSIQRYDRTPVETRMVPITPPTLGPNEQGRFEFELPGDPSVNRYVITKLMSNDKQVLFRTND